MDFDPQRTPGFSIGRANHLLQLEIRNGLKAAGLKVSAEGLSILILLHHINEPIRVGDLAELAVRDGTTLKRQLDGLAQQKYISQEHDRSDGRVVLISCTLEGSKAVNLIDSTLRKIRKKALQGINKDEVAVATIVLDRIRENLLESSDRSASNGSAS